MKVKNREGKGTQKDTKNDKAKEQEMREEKETQERYITQKDIERKQEIKIGDGGNEKIRDENT